jgi:hypothetical protein
MEVKMDDNMVNDLPSKRRREAFQRWVFLPENRIYRFFSIIFCVAVSLYAFSIYNLFVGSLSFFLFLYFIGIFKDRKRIDLLLNEDPVGVATRITSLVNSSFSEIKIFTGSINPKVYCHEDVLSSFDNAIKRGVQVSFITNWKFAQEREEKNAGNEIINWAKKDRLKIFDFAENVDKINHFIVVDKKSFRVEGFHDDQSKKRLAVTAYNNKKALKFSNIFDSLIEKGKVKLIYPDTRFNIL